VSINKKETSARSVRFNRRTKKKGNSTVTRRRSKRWSARMRMTKEASYAEHDEPTEPREEGWHVVQEQRWASEEEILRFEREDQEQEPLPEKLVKPPPEKLDE
jgi:hypothetical protein